MPRKPPFQYAIRDIVSTDNEDLYKEISSRISIILKKQTGSWSAHIDASGTAIIGYNRSAYPDAAFAHELLHIKAELDGLRDPYLRSSVEGFSWEILRFIINHLAHHRIYPEFYDMGFNEEEFLNDNDEAETLQLLRRDVPKLEDVYRQVQKPMDGLIVLMPYLVCVSPHETNLVVHQFKERLEKIAEPSFIKAVNAILEEWRTSKRMDYCLTLAKLCKACGYMNISFAPQSDTSKEISASTVTLD